MEPMLRAWRLRCLHMYFAFGAVVAWSIETEDNTMDRRAESLCNRSTQKQISINDAHTSSFFAIDLESSLGTMSMRKSNVSVFWIAAETSLRCSVRRFESSVWSHDRNVSSKINISHALAKIIGASALII